MCHLTGQMGKASLPQETAALDSLLDAARQGAHSDPTPGPGAGTNALGIGSLPTAPLSVPGSALRRRDNRYAGPDQDFGEGGEATQSHINATSRPPQSVLIAN
jgi:hypothetical protein